ncbi:GNAT family N-acetyltransferase [Paenibacillus sp. JNUCC31]|uniref:GNAT family N-acetyltransferase n=1 Tax=Paenibacillus sp. JNUCC-31 TaxID=2777983 RepID=UPI00177E00C0|nr:GNAT family N-acetyltransferase [Paenibacillus sp. JNUCC-31]QOS78504.1 GNAT family N-acetyltransferase [Paenibacillus sp. JNUCC-31]
MEQRNAPEVRIELWDEGDLGLLRQLNSPEMTVHFGGSETEEKILARHKRYYEIAQNGTGKMFKILLLPHLEVVGSVGYWNQTWKEESVYEIGWSVLPEFQGRGIATEATAKALASIHSKKKKHKFIHAFPKTNNPASNAICRKLGFSYIGECDFEYPVGTIIRCNDWRLSVGGEGR